MTARPSRWLPPMTSLLLLTSTALACSDPTASDRSAPEEEPSGNPRQTMLALADLVRDQEPEGSVWHESEVFGSAWGVGPDGGRYGVHELELQERWIRLDGGDLAVRRRDEHGWELASEADEAAWEADGSPTSWPADHDRDTPPISDSHGPSEEPQEAYRDYGFGASDDPESGLDFEGLRELSADVDELRVRFEEEDHPDPPKQAVDLVGQAVTLPVTPEVRAAMYTVAAEQPGLRDLGETTDTLGRPAVGVGIEETEFQAEGAGLELQLLFDPETGSLLSRQYVITETTPVNADWLEPGEVWAFWRYEELGYTDDWPL